MVKLEPEIPLYNIISPLKLSGNSNIFALCACLNEIVRRQECLRTTFLELEGEPRQVICKQHELEFKLVDLRKLPHFIRNGLVEHYILDESMRPFDLRKGPLLRVKLLQITEQNFVLLITTHHIVCDGLSMNILLRELAVIYESFNKGNASCLKELSIQYSDFTLWQHEQFKSHAFNEQLSYWEKQLCDASFILELPSDRPRPQVPTYKGATFDFVISNQLAIPFKDLCRKQESTLFMGLLTTFNILLSKYTREKDILIGTAISNRIERELENLIGFINNMLVLRIKSFGYLSFEQLLKRVLRTTLEAYENQDVPFEMIVEKLYPNRSIAYNPIFQVVFQVQPSLSSTKGLSDTSIIGLGNIRPFARFDLAFEVVDMENGLFCLFEYSRDLFDKPTIFRMASHFKVLLSNINSNPDHCINDINMLTNDEQSRLIESWNKTESKFSVQSCVQEMFESQTTDSLDTISLVYEDQYISYHELNYRANKLAHLLKNKGVATGQVVAVLVETHPDILIALLSILKAGAVYLPIDPKNPEERIETILNDSHAKVLLTRNDSVRGICFTLLQNLRNVCKDVVVTRYRPRILDLDKLSMVDRALVDYRKYNRYLGHGCTKKGISIIASRGCPYKCIYCHRLWPKKNICRSAQNLFDEVRFHYDNGYRTFRFLDDIFNLNKRNSEEFFELIIRNKLDIRISFSNGLRGDLLTSDYIDLMSEAGVMHMGLALETASKRLQRLIGKNLDIEKLLESIHYTIANHPYIILDLFTMVGIPTETEEEALSTLEFIKSIKWLHFPFLFNIRIYPNTGLERLALKHGASKKALQDNARYDLHEFGNIEVSKCSRNFLYEIHNNFINEYFLNEERLEKVIPLQKKVLTYAEMLAKYDSYIPGILDVYPRLRQFIDEGGKDKFYPDHSIPHENNSVTKTTHISGKNETYGDCFGSEPLRILLIDLSQHFSSESHLLRKMVEVPLGLMHILTYLNHKLGDKVIGKIIKGMVDFDNYEELKHIVDDFKPELIGVRAMSMAKDFFHMTVLFLSEWCPDVPIITGGPYATSEYNTLLSDLNVDLAVLGEGEVTFVELIERILENNKRIPEDELLQNVPGIAFIPRCRKNVDHLHTSNEYRKVIILDHLFDTLEWRNTSNLPNMINVSDLSYIIYTSGSTGKPKGVAMPHLALANLLRWQSEVSDIRDDKRTLQFSSLCFDVSIQEILSTWCSGGTLIVPTLSVKQEPQELLSFINCMSVERLFLPYVALLQIAEIASAMKLFPKTLKYIITAGEQLRITQVIREFFENLRKCRFYNHYGPSESHVVTAFNLESLVEKWSALPPIGHAISNTQIYILDESLNPVPTGIMGEIYIGGVNLALGYINDPALSAERFIPNLYSDTGSLRLYKTGDLGRYLENGNIEFHGRLDHQVKILGYRVELSEIEAVLTQHSDLKEVVVLAHKNDLGKSSLVAYVICCADKSISSGALQEFLSQKLPYYMIPSNFVFLDKLPLTRSGKIDRRRLINMDSDGLTLEREFILPQTELEKALAGIWTELLGIDRVGIHDDFFHVGGNSIIAVQLISRIMSICGAQLTLKEVFEKNTIFKLAELISEKLLKSVDQSELEKIIADVDDFVD